MSDEVFDMPVLPYAGTSGWSGSDTSRERALRNDHDGTTSAQQSKTIDDLNYAKADGLTWKELADINGWHHGQASGVLSTLHKANLVCRLIQRRNRCAIYVLWAYQDGRDYAARTVKKCKHCGGEL